VVWPGSFINRRLLAAKLQKTSKMVQKKVKKSTESINSRLQLVIKSGASS